MKKYCRYCSWCVTGNGNYCTCHDKRLGRLDRVTNCKDFDLSPLGDVDTGRQYKPRKKREDVEPQGEQVTIDELETTHVD